MVCLSERNVSKTYPLRDVVDFESGECRKLMRGNIKHKAFLLCTRAYAYVRFAAVVHTVAVGLFWADAFQVQRKRSGGELLLPG